MVADAWFGDPDAWEYLAEHATGLLGRVEPRTAEWRLLLKAADLGREMAAALRAAETRHRTAQLRAASEASDVDPVLTLVEYPKRPPAGNYLSEVRHLLDQGMSPDLVCSQVGRRPDTIARALGRAGDKATAAEFYRVVRLERRVAARAAR